ncbi:MAG: hypothetical protein JXA57_19710, partial [Armatimonadetes bacterium]|nr:hypothetical protein [Armatimonadota bacterium]
MTRRDILRTTVGAASAVGLAGVAAAAPRRLRNVGIASPGIGARVRAEGPDFDIIEYCNSLGLGAAHIYLRGDAGPDTLAKMREQLNKYDMRITISVRTPQSDDELPQYESTIKALSEMDGRVYCILEQYSGRRYE